MPINGLSDRVRIPRLGKLRLGVKKRNAAGVEYPAAVDYFVLSTEDANLEKAFREIYGEQPRAVDVAFPTNNPEDWASQFYRAYSRTRGLTCKGDGHTANRMVFVGERVIAAGKSEADRARAVEWAEVDCTGRECPYYLAKDCRELMMLQFILPRLPGLGIWQLDTSSINSILNINGGVALVKGIAGTIALQPLLLRVVPMEVSPEGKKKTVHVLQLDIGVRLAELAAFKRPLMLPEPEESAPEDERADPQPDLPAGGPGKQAGEPAPAEPTAPTAREADSIPSNPSTGKPYTRVALVKTLTAAEQRLSDAAIAFPPWDDSQVTDLQIWQHIQELWALYATAQQQAKDAAKANAEAEQMALASEEVRP